MSINTSVATARVVYEFRLSAGPRIEVLRNGTRVQYLTPEHARSMINRLRGIPAIGVRVVKGESHGK